MAKAADPTDVMDVSELKQLLHLSKRQQINCAIGLTRDKQGVVLLHRRTKPRKLLAELLRQQGTGLQLDRATLRFGHANVAGGSDSTTVHFTVNKASPDTLRVKMLEKLRPAGYQHCDINVDAGIEDETEDEDDGTPAAGSPAGPPGGTGAGDAAPPATTDAPATLPAGPPNKAPPDQGGQPDPAVLKATLHDLAEQIRPTITTDPARSTVLMKIARTARDDLDRNDAQGAASEIESLRQALNDTPAATAPKAGPAPASPSAPDGPASVSEPAGGAPAAPAIARTSAPAPSSSATPAATPAAPAASPMPPATETAAALAKLLDIDPATFNGREDKAAKVMARLQQFRSLPERDQLNFPGYIAAQGFPPNDKFFQLCTERALDARNGNPAWAKGVNPEPPDTGRMDRLKAAIEWAGKDLGGDVGNQLLALAEPENLAIMGGFAALFLAAQASPVGWIADAAAGALVLGTALAVGVNVVDVLKKLDRFIDEVNKRDGKPAVAGKALSEVVATISVGALIALVLHGGAKAAGRLKFKPPGANDVDVVASKGGLVRLPKDQVAGLRVGGDLDALGKKAPDTTLPRDDGRPHTADIPPDRTAAILKTKKKWGLREDLDQKWFDEKGDVRWPENNGAAGPWTAKLLEASTLVDRYGADTGKFVSPKGPAFEARALPSSAEEASYHVYRVLKRFEVKQSVAAPWFDQIGGATQYLFDRRISELIRDEFLEEVK